MTSRALPDRVTRAASAVSVELDGDPRDLLAVGLLLCRAALPRVKESNARLSVENALQGVSYALGRIGWPPV